MRIYIRMDPRMVEKKLAKGYTLAQIGAYAMLLGQAEQQPERGRFKSKGLLREAMDCMVERLGPRARTSQHLPFLIAQRDVVKLEDGYYVEGWDPWQEGDHTPRERMELVRGRRGRPGDPESPGARRQRAYRNRREGVETASQIDGDSDVTCPAPSDASPGDPSCDERHPARDLDVSISGKPKAVSISGCDGDAAPGPMHAKQRAKGPSLTPEAIVLLQGYLKVSGAAQHSPSEGIKAMEFLAEVAETMTAADAVARMQSHHDYCQQHGLPLPRSLGGYWKALRSEHDYRRDNGVRRVPDGASTRAAGLTGVSSILQGMARQA